MKSFKELRCQNSENGNCHQIEWKHKDNCLKHQNKIQNVAKTNEENVRVGELKENKTGYN